MNLKNANLKNILNFKELEKLFRNYANTSGLDVALYDLNGEEQLCVRKNDSICNLIKDNHSCREKIVYSGKKAQELGSGYIYETPCGLIMCITPRGGGGRSDRLYHVGARHFVGKRRVFRG